MYNHSEIPITEEKPKVKPWLKYGLLILVAEKIGQHIFVTLCFIYNFFDIRSTVAIDYNWLLYSGALVTLLFAAALWSVIKDMRWGLNLIVGLALFDIFGEFIAQGSLFITINETFIVAIALLVCVWLYKGNLHHKTKPA